MNETHLEQWLAPGKDTMSGTYQFSVCVYHDLFTEFLIDGPLYCFQSFVLQIVLQSLRSD